MILLPLNAARHDESDDMCFTFLQSLEGKLFRFKLSSKIPFLTISSIRDVQNYRGVASAIGRRRMKHISADSSCRHASNGGKFMSLAPIDGKLFTKNCF